MQPDLSFALELADVADAITLARFRATDLHVETKPDLSPVSEADRAVEEALRKRIARERPGESVLGEEEGGEDGDWVIDPIDATKNYVRGIPLYATLIALEGRVAVVSAPALGKRWWAARGEGAFADGRPLRVSGIGRIEDAVLTFTSPRGQGPGFHRLVERSWAPRGFGDFWQYMLLAEGAVDLCVESVANHWDLAAPKLIVEEAGGVLTDLRGVDTAAGGDCLASNGLLHAEALAELNG
ncbi:MAG TPA: inositol monophosphatase family protein [Gaiellaceae bacterium]